MVHFVCHHPNRGDEKWYEKTIKSLEHTSLVEKTAKKAFTEGQETRVIQSLFAEISAVAMASHAIFSTYIVRRWEEEYRLCP